MNWFGSPLYLVAAGAAIVITLIVDWWQLRTGRTVHYQLVSHRKLRAVARTRGAVVRTPSEQPHPRAWPPDSRSGAGPKPLAAVTDRRLHDGGQGHTRATASSPLSGGPARTPVDVADPRSVTSTGHHKQPVVGTPESTTGPTPLGDPAGGEQGCESGPPTFGAGGPVRHIPAS